MEYQEHLNTVNGGKRRKFQTFFRFREYFKERGEQYGAVWGNIAPFPFGSLIAKQLRGPIWSNMVQYGK